MATIITESQLHEREAYPCAEDLKERSCLLCKEPAGVPFVFWSAAGTWIVLHQKCAELFAWGLLRDCWELQLGCKEADIRYYVLANLCSENVKPATVIER